MPRGRKPRTWVRLDCEGILRGSINYLLTLEGQAIWVKMIALSEICGGRPGFIEDNNQHGLPLEYVAQELHCPLEALQVVLQKMGQDGAIKVNGAGSIELVNFKHYQFSEYDRQKPYRQKKTDEPQTFEDYIEAIRPNYPDLNVEDEWERCQTWWNEGKKEIKRPKSALRNWLDKAREIKGGQNGTHKQNTKPGIPGNRSAGAFADLEERD